MHPAKSVILFTTASGVGYGLLFLLIASHMSGLVGSEFGFGFVAFAISFSVIGAGLLSSTFHLGHPERAWRAVTQWRSSWLSREGVMALFTFAPTGLYALGWLFFPSILEMAGAALGAVSLISCAVTVFCTAMIYASLKPVKAWCNRWVPVGYLLLALVTGSVVFNALLLLFGQGSANVALLGILLSMGGLIWKLGYWKYVAQNPSASTAETATGLGAFGSVSLFEAPHSEANYLMKEMGFRVARKHSAKLRKITLVCAFILPALLLSLGFILTGTAALLLSLVALAVMSVGIVTERWLFFAEARHSVGLYYGESRV